MPENDLTGRNRNVEIKARLADLEHARSVAKRLANDDVVVLHHVDTYFVCQDGRLKLREIDGQRAQLIWYRRANDAGPKLSDFTIVPVEDADAFRRGMEQVVGVRNVVSKRRDLYWYQNVRIHLDDVKELGIFLELEAVLSSCHDQETAESRIQYLLDEFQISPSDLLTSSYADMD